MLGIYALFGFLARAANSFCRSCMIKREDLRAYTKNSNFDPSFTERSKQLHEEQLAEISIDPSQMETYGFRENSILNDLKHFHVTDNFIFDPMHGF
jgi:hypothetical protein